MIYSSYTSLKPDILPSLCIWNPVGTAESPPASTFEVFVCNVPSLSQPEIFSNSSIPSAWSPDEACDFVSEDI
jgi:hypothetical protein